VHKHKDLRSKSPIQATALKSCEATSAPYSYAAFASAPHSRSSRTIDSQTRIDSSISSISSAWSSKTISPALKLTIVLSTRKLCSHTIRKKSIQTIATVWPQHQASKAKLSKQQRERLTDRIMRCTQRSQKRSDHEAAEKPSSRRGEEGKTKGFPCRTHNYKELIKKIIQSSAAPAPGHSPNSSGRALPKVYTRCVRVSTVLQKQPRNRLVASIYSHLQRKNRVFYPAEQTITKSLSNK
jgi:hypothetical protein